MRRLRSAWPLAASAALAAGCASYRPSPLPVGDDLARSVRDLRVDTSILPEPTLRAHRFDPSDGLDIDEVAMLAVANSPDLKTLRADAGVSRAQAFSAGLLPDPQLSLSSDFVMHPFPGSTTAYTAGLLVDVSSLLARSSLRAAGDAESRKTDLDLLWLEWQTVAKARLLFAKLDAFGRAQALLADERTALKKRVDDAMGVVDQGLVTRDAVTPLLTASQDADRQWSDLERQRNQARHDLNTVLGLSPDVDVPLVGSADVATMDEPGVRSALAAAPRRRPDLLALQAGFEAQDDRYRGALRAQFPAITIGPQRARDTSNVDTLGFSLGITLPLFNRNRGNIAIESATRDKLRLDYQQRLDTTASESNRLLQEQQILRRQIAGIDASLPALEQAAAQASRAFEANDLDALVLTNVDTALLARRLERVNAREALQEQAIALQALLGTTLDRPATADPAPSSSHPSTQQSS